MDNAANLAVGGRLVLASVMLGTSLLISAGPRVAAAAGDGDSDAPWSARVAGTQGGGLLVRSGPGQEFPSQGILVDGARVQVVSSAELDRTGRSWYTITGWDASGRRGWSAGEFLARVDPGDPEPPGALQAATAGRSFQARMTAYSYQTATGGAHGSLTRSGTPVRWGVVAVDPTVVPLGTRLLIEGYDIVFVAEDTGGGVRGNHVDIFFPDYASAVRFGVQNRTVTILIP